MANLARILTDFFEFPKFCFLLSGTLAALWVFLSDQIQEFPQPIKGVMELVLFSFICYLEPGIGLVCFFCFGNPIHNRHDLSLELLNVFNLKSEYQNKLHPSLKDFIITINVLHNLLNYLAHKNPALGLDFWNLCQTKKFVFILDFRNGPFDDFRHVWIKSQNFKSWENLKKSVFDLAPFSKE